MTVGGQKISGSGSDVACGKVVRSVGNHDHVTERGMGKLQ